MSEASTTVTHYRVMVVFSDAKRPAAWACSSLADAERRVKDWMAGARATKAWIETRQTIRTPWAVFEPAESAPGGGNG